MIVIFADYLKTVSRFRLEEKETALLAIIYAMKTLLFFQIVLYNVVW
jgi:hypothetical protein